MLVIAIAFLAQAFSGEVEESSGNSATYSGALLILLGLRHNILNYVFGISFERALYYHKFIASVLVLTTIIHIVYAESKGDPTGLALFGLILVVCGSYFIKSYSFELFYFVHIGAFIPIIYH